MYVRSTSSHFGGTTIESHISCVGVRVGECVSARVRAWGWVCVCVEGEGGGHGRVSAYVSVSECVRVCM